MNRPRREIVVQLKYRLEPENHQKNNLNSNRENNLKNQ